jgi:hypothetical protein
MLLDIQTIYGINLGFEIADQEVKDNLGIRFGLTIDLFILRLVFTIE